MKKTVIKWVMIVFIGVLVILSGAYIFYNLSVLKLENYFSQQVFIEAQDTFDGLSSMMGMILKDLKVGADKLSRGYPRKEDVLKSIYERWSPIVSDCGLLSADARISYVYPKYYRKIVGKDISYQRHIIKLMSEVKPVVSSPFRAVEGFESVAVHYPIIRNGKFSGSIWVLIPLKRLFNIFTVKTVNSLRYVWLMTENGVIAYHSDERFINVNLNAPTYDLFVDQKTVELLKRQMKDERVLFKGRYFGRNLIGASIKRKVYGSTWSIAVAVDYSEMEGILTSLRMGIVMTLVISLVVFSVYVFMFVRGIMKREIAQKERMLEEERRRRMDFERQIRETLNSLVTALEERDPYTSGHTQRVAELSLAIGREMGLGPGELGKLRIAALLHDIGKIGIRDSILYKKGPLNNEEMKILKSHPAIGVKILKPLKNLDDDVLSAILLHHEHMDGSGYFHMKGDEIPLLARIIAVADAFDAMTTNRPYRKAMSIKEAVEELKRNSGTQFDPDVVKALISVLKKKNPNLTFL